MGWKLKTLYNIKFIGKKPHKLSCKGCCIYVIKDK